ncbi:outer membrane beta-barrel family protein [Massilibacteroides vaginae]|uniref:outer membrane beta-barrel family protein n=1 Tax=Massilibacteroides vaginae TaxID=1673718 RepID=UPI000A1CF1E0|nr:outer membrane beta-barrel family protein [Massilibacteroides vaginae]
MKASLLLIALFLVLFVLNGFAQVEINGNLINERQESVEFANIVLQSEEEFYGAISDEQGNFTIQASPGNYVLKISVIGYNNHEQTIVLQRNINLGAIKLAESTVEMNEVVVKADRIVRSADRFIVNLANDPTVFGKSGSDVLNLSPGVFVQERDGSISINGKTGTQVYVNERPMRESGAELIRYLQNLKAEDIMRIEVLPTAGAGYDANIQGGIIKITLKRHRDDGIYGHAGASYEFAPGEKVSSFDPSFSLNYKNNGFSLYTQLNFNGRRRIEHVTEEVIMWSPDRSVNSVIDFPISERTFSGRIGGIYELNEKQSIGLEGYLSPSQRKNKSYSDLVEIENEKRTDINSFYNGKNKIESYSAAANYLLQLDESGSNFKILLDYFHNMADDKQNYHSSFRGYLDYDSVYRSSMYTTNDLYSASTDLTIRKNDYTTFATGLKYSHSKMDNDILYEYQHEGNWLRNEPYTSENLFTEDIAAAYASFSSRLKKISYSVGLRGEYTYVSPKTNKSDETKDQRYFKLFPSANIMLPFGNDNKHSLVLNYNRNIFRVPFSLLNPFRLPASEFLYIEGNPELQPILFNNYSLALGLFNRYNLTVGITDTENAVGKVIEPDSQNPEILVQRMANMKSNKTYYLSANASLKPFEWWQVNLNLSGRRNIVEIYDGKRSMNTFQGSMSNMFTLPKEIMLDCTFYYSSPFIDGSVKTEIDPQLYLSLRKQFLDKKLSAKLYVNNPLNMSTAKVTSDEKDFRRNLRSDFMFRTFGVSLTYNFQAGKKIQVKNVESGAAEEKARMR